MKVIYNGYEFQIDPDHPTWRFKGGKPKMPPVPPPPAIPSEGEDAGISVAKAMRRKSGYAKTILTGDLIPKSSGKNKVLGGGEGLV